MLDRYPMLLLSIVPADVGNKTVAKLVGVDERKLSESLQYRVLVVYLPGDFRSIDGLVSIHDKSSARGVKVFLRQLLI